MGEDLTPEEKIGSIRPHDVGLVTSDGCGRMMLTGFARPRPWERFRDCAGGSYWQRERFTQIALGCELVADYGWDPRNVDFEVGRLDVAGYIGGRVGLAVETKVFDDEFDDFVVAIQARASESPLADPESTVRGPAAGHWRSLVASKAGVFVVATVDRWVAFEVIDGPRPRLVRLPAGWKPTPGAVARRCR